jgi:hypothetical protein
MNPRNFAALLPLFLTLVGFGACTKEEPSDTSDSESDADADTDTDTDADADADADTDADTDADADADLGLIFGTTLLEGVTPVDGATVTAFIGGREFGTTTSHDGGYYEIVVDPGDYLLNATYDVYWGAAETTVGQGEEIHLDLSLCRDKNYAPYIYLYPKRVQRARVLLIPPAEVEITEVDPPYRDGWSVRAEPSGRIDGVRDFLYYESTISDAGFQEEEGWAVPGEEIFSWFEAMLPELGLNPAEVQDFMDYWKFNMPYAACYNVFPQPTDLPEQHMGLRFLPAPDSLLRVWLRLEGTGVCPPLPAPEIQPFVRQGFTAVEWGLSLKSETFVH